jgi:chemotaxis protein methyltransferase CheR
MSTAELRSFIEAELGIMMPPSKESLLHSRLQRRLREVGVASLHDYARYLRASPDGARERRELTAAVTTNTTEFFREPAQLAHLVDTGVAEALARDPHGTVRVWSAGCSSGEEPYSIAMLLAEAQRARPGWDFAILATDVSPPMLAYARRGVYDHRRTASIPAALARRYLMPARDAAQDISRIRPELRAKIAFHELNFMDDHYPIDATFDVIFFRNVAIYFDHATQEAVVAKLCRRLRPGGYLLLGQTESLLGRRVPVTHLGPSVYRLPPAPTPTSPRGGPPP